jgi:cytochrome P450
MRRLREEFKVKAAALVDALIEMRDIEAVHDLAEAFPLEVFPDAVGLRSEGRENLLPYSTMVFNSFGPRNEIFRASTEAAEPVLAWIHAQCARGACAPAGFAADIWAAHDAGEITSEEAPILVRSLLTAGLDTTVNGFANAVLAFATHPEQWTELLHDRSLIKPAFDEVLRWESPVQTFFRTTTRQVRLAGAVVPEGAKVLLFLGAANRDPRKWPEPEQFQVSRRPTGHVGLGAGIHVCVGQLVARLEAEVLFEALADRVGEFVLRAAPERKPNNTLRSLSRLEVRLVPR